MRAMAVCHIRFLAGLHGYCWIRVSPTELSVLARDDWQPLLSWPLSDIKKYGKDDGVFSFEVGPVSQFGPGIYYFAALHPEDIFRVVDRYHA